MPSSCHLAVVLPRWGPWPRPCSSGPAPGCSRRVGVSSPEDVTVRRGEAQGVMVPRCAALGDRRHDDLRAEPRRRLAQRSSSSTAPGSASTTSSRSRGAWSASASTWRAQENPAVSPECSRLRVSSRLAAVSWRASRSAGTMRWGMTEVNHEPGPRMTQSASRTASIVSAADGGSAGSSAMLRT